MTTLQFILLAIAVAIYAFTRSADNNQSEKERVYHLNGAFIIMIVLLLLMYFV